MQHFRELVVFAFWVLERYFMDCAFLHVDPTLERYFMDCAFLHVDPTFEIAVGHPIMAGVAPKDYQM